jgi:NAD(P)H-hydrate repair Nnr-like enzyme with NAD(P)H-hydrate dehydratase domain
VRGFPEASSGDVAAGAADEIAEMANGVSATLLGPGLLDKDCAQELLADLVPQLECGVVLDALGSCFVTEHRDGLHHLEGQCVLTVNPREMARTLGVEVDDVESEPERLTQELARTARVVVVCGGADKVVAAPDGRTFRIVRGGRGLGVSGSGDVQAGLVTGLLARGAPPLQAAVWGGFLHGAAGEELARTTGDLGFLARELPAVVPGLLRSLQG